jgi:putative membrane protein
MRSATKTWFAIAPTRRMPGANSFTEGQAKDRIEKAGFSQVSNLKKDDQGIWRGTAMRGGAQTNVALDYRGNVVAK